MAEERTRVAEERVDKERREQAEAKERESRVRLRAQEAALAAARERERELEEERRRAEEQARLEGIRAGEFARLRDEAARKAAEERALAEREHELRLLTIRRAASVHTLRAGLAGTSIVALAACAALVWLELGVHPERLAKLEVDYSSLTASERARADRAEGLLKSSEAARRQLEQKQLLAPVTPPSPAPASTHRAPPSRPTPGIKPKPGRNAPPCKDDHDPLNPCLSP